MTGLFGFGEFFHNNVISGENVIFIAPYLHKYTYLRGEAASQASYAASWEINLTEKKSDSIILMREYAGRNLQDGKRSW